MKIKLTRLLRFSLLMVCISLLIIYIQGIYLNNSLQATEPDAAEPCLPKVEQKNIFERQQIGFTEHQNKRYYLFYVIKNKPVPPFDDWFHKDKTYTIVSVAQIGCLVEMPTEDSFQSTLENYVPLVVARNLALILLKYEIAQAGGVEAYIKQENEAHFGEDYGKPWLFFPEDVWAWQQLGEKLPEPHKIIKDLSEVYDESYSPMYD